MSSVSSAPPAQPRLSAFRALRHRNYRWFWTSSAGQTIGQGIMQLTLAWLVLTITDSVSQFGLVVFLQGLPMLGFVFFGGVVADRLDRRKVLMAAQAVLMVSIFALALLTTAGLVHLWHVYVTALVTGLVQGLSLPARISYVRSLVDREDVMNAVALNAMLMNASRVVGPSLAGGLIEWGGIDLALYVNAAVFVPGILGLLPIRNVVQAPRRDGASAARDLVGGFRYARETPHVLAVVLLALAMGFFGMPYLHLTPAFARDVLGLGAGQTGLLLMAGGLGALVGSLVLATMSGFRHKTLLLIALILVFALGLLAFAFTPWFAASVALLALLGAASTTAISLFNTVTALTVPQHMLGRVTSFILAGASLMFVGTLPLGFLGDLLGLRIALAIGAATLLCLALLIGVVWPPLRRLKV